MTAIIEICSTIDDVIAHLFHHNEDLEYIGLYKGKMGNAYLNFYLYKYLAEEKYAYRSIHLITEVIGELNDPNAQIHSNPCLVNGIAGIGACFQLLQDEEFLSTELSDQLEILDEYLLTFYKVYLEERNTDFFSGAIGILYYFACRYISSSAKHLSTMETVVSCLEAYLMEDIHGIRLTTKFGYLKTPGIDLSTAHGIVALYLILLNLYESGYRTESVQKIVTKGIDYLLYIQKVTENTSNHHTLFPNFVSEANVGNSVLPLVHHSHRLAWCNGDLNILWLLERAGRLLKKPVYIDAAAKIRDDVVSRRNFETTRIEFSYFCHGTSGVTQTYRRLFQLTNETLYLDAYQYWLGRCQRQLEQDFLTGVKYPYRSSMLFGWAGAVLALLNYKTDQDYKWDKIFLLS